MSAPLTPGVSSLRSSEGLLDRMRSFWQRISEGRQLDELWSQFTADARASYGFYMKEAEGLESQRGLRRLFGIAKTLFWSLLMKLTPARRVLLLVAFAMLVMSGIKFHSEKNVALDMNFEAMAALLFLLLLSLELADKVTMKRDLEIAREIQSWLVPSEPPKVAGADIAFATPPQKSPAGGYYHAPFFHPAPLGKVLGGVSHIFGQSVPSAPL